MVEHPSPGEQLVHDAAEAVDVARRGRGLAARLLRGERVRRAEDGPGRGQRRLGGLDARDAEVDEGDLRAVQRVGTDAIG